MVCAPAPICRPRSSLGQITAVCETATLALALHPPQREIATPNHIRRPRIGQLTLIWSCFVKILSAALVVLLNDS